MFRFLVGAKRFYCCSKLPDRLLGSPSLLCNGCMELFPLGSSCRGVNLTTHLHLGLTLGISGAITPFVHMTSPRSQEQSYACVCVCIYMHLMSVETRVTFFLSSIFPIRCILSECVVLSAVTYLRSRHCLRRVLDTLPHEPDTNFEVSCKVVYSSYVFCFRLSLVFLHLRVETSPEFLLLHCSLTISIC